MLGLRYESTAISGGSQPHRRGQAAVADPVGTLQPPAMPPDLMLQWQLASLRINAGLFNLMTAATTSGPLSAAARWRSTAAALP